jgi:hypothetical protein
LVLNRERFRKPRDAAASIKTSTQEKERILNNLTRYYSFKTQEFHTSRGKTKRHGSSNPLLENIVPLSHVRKI